MTGSPFVRLQWKIAQVYERGRKVHDNLALEPESYTNHLFFVMQKHCGVIEESPRHFGFLNRLRTEDLYLTVACAEGSEAAWQRFQALYQRFIRETARLLCPHRSAADDLAYQMLGHLFLKDAAGRSRIASFDGQVALSSWLWSVIAHKALDERHLKYHQFERLDSLAERSDSSSQQQAERGLRASLHWTKILPACQIAVASLTHQQRSLLWLYYQEGLSTAALGERYEMSKSNVSYHLKQARQKLGEEFSSMLKSQYNLSDAAIEDCKEELLENPAYSLLTLLRVD
ncbi:MAG: sigma-70 family RNA polymerase sigma factor [Acidobacteria bacterium]|nr:sigma-70 family RNA polymerase sigma factor [Acidobacteriota bacterium]